MEALKGVSTLLRTLYLCKETSTVSLFGLKIPNYSMRIMSLIPLYICCAAMVAFCILKVDNIFTLLSVGYCLCGTWFMHCIQLSLIANESFLSQSMNHLKSLIRQRTIKVPFRTLFFIDFKKKTFVLSSFLGHQRGGTIATIYEKRETNIRKVLKRCMLFTCFLLGTVFGDSFLKPVLNAFFGWSPRETWYLPVPAV